MEQLIARKDGAVGWMLFNNPERRNALTFEMWQAMADTLERFDQDNDVRIVAIAGVGGKAFASGADISEFDKVHSSTESTEAFHDLVDFVSGRLSTFRKPTLAMIQGYCMGAGLAVALCCDLRIAAVNSRFGIPAAKMGLGYPFSGLARLAGLVGSSSATEIFFTGRQFDAVEALNMGLVNRVQPNAEIEPYVNDYVRNIADNAPLTIAAVKLCINEYAKPSDERDLKACHAAVERCFASKDFAEGRRAFAEKRKPEFVGE